MAWVSVVLFGCAIGGDTASAETYYWDTNGVTAGFGTAGGTWGSDAFWSTNSAGDTLPSITNPSTSDDLNFGYTSTGLSNGTINVVTGSANSLTFAAGSGAITVSGGTITMASVGVIAVNNTSNVISSVIAGAATSLTKSGAGALTLNGANTYDGGTTISAGTVIVGTTNALGSSGTITLGDVNSGANAITLAATANPYSRPFTVANYGGTVTLATSGGKFSGAITLNRSVKLVPNFNNAANFDGGFLGSGDLVISNYNGYGVTFRFADNTFTGNVYVLAGSTLSVGGSQALNGTLKSLIPDSSVVNVLGTMTVALLGRNETIDALTGSGTVTFGQVGDMLTVGGGNGTGTFSGAISGVGALAKIGAGTQILTGPNNSYSGGTTISGGTLLMNGKLTGAGVVTVNSSGTLGGTGMVSGAMTVTSGGTLSPGDPASSNGIGRVTVSNDVTLAANGIFAAQIAAGGLADMLVSTRTISNQNATLSLSVLDLNALKAESFTIMVASNIVGTFNGLPGGAGLSVGGRSFVISYPGNTNVVLQSMSLGMLLMVQ